MFKYFIIMIFCFGWALAEEDQKEKSYIEKLSLTFQAFGKEEGEGIWPLFQLSDSSHAFHFKNGHVYAFGLAKHSPLWEKRWVQHYSVLFCAQYPIALPPLNPAFPLEDKKTFVMSLDHGDSTSFMPLLTFIHERFHTHQFRFFPRERVVKAEIGDYQNIENLTFMEFENRSLTCFLEAVHPVEKMSHLKDFIAINQTRRKQMHPSSLLWEDHQQKMEGLADYVSVKTYQVFPYLPDFKAETALLEMRKKKTIGMPSLVEDAIKGRQYFVGAVVGWALDFCEVKNWKLRIQNEFISLQTLLEGVLFIGETEREQRFSSVKNSLDWTKIQYEIAEQLQKERDEMEKVIQTFQEQSGIVIHMGLPEGRMSAGGRHEKSVQIGQSKALMKDTSLSTSQDQSWILRFKAMPLLLEEQNGHRMFKLNPQTILQLDGKELTLEYILQQESREIAFSSIAWKEPHCELNSKRAGKIVLREKQSISLIFY